jgi:hypothetical protein
MFAKMAFLSGAWCCALGMVIPGLLLFILGGFRDMLKGDAYALAFGASSLCGLVRFILF